MMTKRAKLILKNPAVITNILYGNGVKLDIKSINTPYSIKYSLATSNLSVYP